MQCLARSRTRIFFFPFQSAFMTMIFSDMWQDSLGARETSAQKMCPGRYPASHGYVGWAEVTQEEAVSL